MLGKEEAEGRGGGEPAGAGSPGGRLSVCPRGGGKEEGSFVLSL